MPSIGGGFSAFPASVGLIEEKKPIETYVIPRLAVDALDPVTKELTPSKGIKVSGRPVPTRQPIIPVGDLPHPSVITNPKEIEQLQSKTVTSSNSSSLSGLFSGDIMNTLKKYALPIGAVVVLLMLSKGGRRRR